MKYSNFIYKKILKPVLFSIDPELVHESTIYIGEWLGNNNFLNLIIKNKFVSNYPNLLQIINGINFDTPIGLAAGFDYEAKLTKILPSIGFGFETIGTITNQAYEGNTRPLLGRLPKSRSLMVNKGFKNQGARVISNKLTNNNFEIPIGISIGRTNNPNLNQSQSVDDIISAFDIFEKSKIKNSYYEINISCPNLYGNINFYSQDNLNNLLAAIEKRNIKKLFFVKMPIEKDNKTTEQLLKIISNYKYINGVIFGNLQKNRTDPSLDQNEVSKWKTGNFSGKPTWDRSNELISLCYKKYKNRFIIIGCGGVFSAQDAYTKIKLGASLIQLITGLVFEGPTLVSDINKDLSNLLKLDGFDNINQAIGISN